MSKRLVVAMTGASGAVYGQRFVDAASRHFDDVYLIVSETSRQVIATELGVCAGPRMTPDELIGRSVENVHMLSPTSFFQPPASGSFRHDGMVVIPCTTGTLGRIASGTSEDLITRAADVTLKERRPLILLVRETPLSLVHLRNMTALAEAGAVIMPASPGFYHRPSTIESLVDMVVARVLSLLGVPDVDFPEWQVRQ